MNDTATKHHRATPDAKNPGATIIDLSANPDDFSPAINHIVTSIQEARAAGQKVIAMVGEQHDTISQVTLAPLLRRGLEEAGNKDKPVIALEHEYNFLDNYLPYFIKESHSFHDAIRHTLQNLKQNNCEHYHRLQAQAVAASSWPYAPVTKLENISDWLRQKLPVQLIDMASIANQYIDINDPDTAKFVKAHSSKEGDSFFDLPYPKEMLLRNLWMMAGLREISKAHGITIFPVGLFHLGGYQENNTSYASSLHELGVKTDPNVKIITVFQEDSYYHLTFTKVLSAEAQSAMNNPDTIIVRGGNEIRNRQGLFGSISEEAATLRKIFNASSFPAHDLCRNENDYENKREAMKTDLQLELEQIIS